MVIQISRVKKLFSIGILCAVKMTLVLPLMGQSVGVAGDLSNNNLGDEIYSNLILKGTSRSDIRVERFVIGTPYLFNDFRSGKIFINDNEHKVKSMRYDLANNILEMHIKGALVSLDAGEIDQFEFNINDTIKIFRQSSSYEQIENKGICEEISIGEIKIIVHKYIYFKPPDFNERLQYGSKYAEYIPKDEFYLKKGDNQIKVSRKKHLKAVYDSKRINNAVKVVGIPDFKNLNYLIEVITALESK